MLEKISLNKESYQFFMDGYLIAIIFITALSLIMNVISHFWPMFDSMHAPIGTLAVGIVFCMMFCRIASIRKKVIK